MFDTIVVAGIPLLLVVLGLVQFIKGFGLEGNAVKGLSLAVGLLLGGAYQYSIAAPADFAGWFSLVVFGLGLGLVASGLYEANQTSKG
jgi:hypothetical protein